MTRKQTQRLIALLLICLAFSLVPHTAQAQGLPTRTFKVDTFEDLYDNVQDRSCASLSGKCSLRAAVTEAGIIYDGTPAFVHIKLPPGVYTLSLKTPPFAGSSEVHYGDLDLPGVDELTTPNEVLIEGTGGPGNPSIIDANFIDRVLELGERRKLTLRNLIIKNGLIEADNDNDDAVRGGGIAMRFNSTLTLENVRLTNHTVRCISESACTFTQGGAIYSGNANLSLLNVELDHNSADRGSAIEFWDGFPQADEYEFTVKNAAIHHNNAKNSTIRAKGRLFLTNTTMTDNQSTDSNYYEIQNYAETWVQNSTIILAAAKMHGLAYTGDFYLRNSLLLHSQSTQPTFSFCVDNAYSHFISKGGNIFSDDSCNPDPALHDLVLSYPQARLGPLADYGGPTPSIALLTGSPAINRLPGQCIAAALESGSITEAPLTVDQRGSPRNDGRCDSGAFEAIYLQYLPLIRK